MSKPCIGDSFTHHFSFTPEQLHDYARISGDTNAIHVEQEYEQQSAFGKCIVHGYFGISVFSKVYGTLLYPDGHVLISQSARYVRPVYTGQEYTAVFTVKEIFPSKNRVCYLNEIVDSQTKDLKVTGEAVLWNQIHYNW